MSTKKALSLLFANTKSNSSFYINKVNKKQLHIPLPIWVFCSSYLFIFNLSQFIYNLIYLF